MRPTDDVTREILTVPPVLDIPPVLRDRLFTLIELFQEEAYSWGFEDGKIEDSTPPTPAFLKYREMIRSVLGFEGE